MAPAGLGRAAEESHQQRQPQQQPEEEYKEERFIRSSSDAWATGRTTAHSSSNGADGVSDTVANGGRAAAGRASFSLPAYETKQQQGGGKGSRSGVQTPATVPMTEPTSPTMLVGPDGEEIVLGPRRKKSVSERAKKGTSRCAHMLTPCAKILVALMGFGALIFFATDDEGVKKIDVSVIGVPFGDIRGTITEEYQEYLGIPYARPPRRFGPPEPWAAPYPDGYLDATVPPAPCAQIVGNRVLGSERDCLRLSIFAPTPGSSLLVDGAPPASTEAGAGAEGHQHGRTLLRRGLKEQEGHGAEEEGEEGVREVVVPPRPVMVYFHGGDFFEGAADEVDGRRLAVDDNVIVVSAAYRLGPLGFLAHPDMRRGEGNLGLLDQRAALLWVQEHIHAFNGDPARVTVFGRGAGATSACLQAILPPGQHHQDDAGARATITQAAIVESGACYALPLDRALARGQEFAAAANCSSLACLEALPLRDLLWASKRVSAPRFRFWQPVVDGAVVPRPASQLLAQAKGLALITGGSAADADDGAAQHHLARSAMRHPHGSDEDYVAYVRGPMRVLEGLEALTDVEVEGLLRLYPPAAEKAAAAAAPDKAEEVVGEAAALTPKGPGEADTEAAAAARLTGNRLAIAQIVSDAHFWCPALAAARALPDPTRAFVYYRSHTHAGEAEDLLLAEEEMEAYWTNFARSTATPNTPRLPPQSSPQQQQAEGQEAEKASAHHKAEEEDDVAIERPKGEEAAVRESLAHWPPFADGGEGDGGNSVLVFEDGGHTAVEAPDRLAFCAFWDTTKVYLD